MKKFLSYFPKIYRFRIYKYQNARDLIEIDGIVFKKMTLENVNDVIWWDKEKVQAYTRLLKEGNIGMYAYCDGKVVAQAIGFIVDLPKYKKITRYLAVKPASAIIGNGGIHPDFQGRKIYNGLMSAMTAYLQKEGFTEIYGDIVVENIAPQKACEKAGFVYIENNLRFQIRSRVLFNIRFKKNSKLFR